MYSKLGMLLFTGLLSILCLAAGVLSAGTEQNPLPQEPVAERARTDAEDNNLHGSVKTVYQEREDLSGSASEGRRPNSMEYFNNHGNLTKTELYDYKGNLSDVMLYGYIDGARVMTRKTIEHEYDPPLGVGTAEPPGAAKPKVDPRYSNKITFKYDDQKRLIEKTWFLNNGNLTLRHVYKYSGNQLDHLVYTPDGSLNYHSVSILDDKGNEIERTDFIGEASIEGKYTFSYEFDKNGNWTKQTAAKAVTKDGKSIMEPSYIVYRTIVYY
jgi:hypothetical protein